MAFENIAPADWRMLSKDCNGCENEGPNIMALLLNLNERTAEIYDTVFGIPDIIRN
jgi:hypothetical protein